MGKDKKKFFSESKDRFKSEEKKEKPIEEPVKEKKVAKKTSKGSKTGKFVKSGTDKYGNPDFILE
jgi:hypothetical protein